MKKKANIATPTLNSIFVGLSKSDIDTVFDLIQFLRDRHQRRETDPQTLHQAARR